MLNLEHKIESVTISLDTPKEYIAGIYRCNTITGIVNISSVPKYPKFI